MDVENTEYSKQKKDIGVSCNSGAWESEAAPQKAKGHWPENRRTQKQPQTHKKHHQAQTYKPHRVQTYKHNQAQTDRQTTPVVFLLLKLARSALLTRVVHLLLLLAF